jgi:hypothetical protein
MVSSLFLTGVECATMRVQTVMEPKREETEMKITTIGLDLAKTVFHVVGQDERGKEVMRRKLREMGHLVDLIPAQHVKPLVLGNKNDYNDARAIAEAGEDPLRGGQDPGPAGPAGGAADARAVCQGSNGVVS